jgi:glucan biosynthesis protein C
LNSSGYLYYLLLSGTGTLFTFSKIKWFQFLNDRSIRLIIPLIFGVFFIVPLQTYYKYIKSYSSYIDVYKSGYFKINHLWFIEILFVLSIVLIPLILFLKPSSSYRLINLLYAITSKNYGIILGAIPLILITIFLQKIHPSDSNGITNGSSTFYYSIFFVTGMLFTFSKTSWYHLKTNRKFNFTAFVISTLVFYIYCQARLFHTIFQ